eukprot:10611851-Karenia_brevis.AAC.1
MIQGVEDQGPWVEKTQVQVETGVRVDTCSVEKDGSSKKSWHVGAFEKVPHATRGGHPRARGAREHKEGGE